MDTTENLAIFWERGFGKDLAHPDRLEGHSMDVNLPLLRQQLESFYAFFRDSLQFSLPDSRSQHTRMMVMLRYSLEGTAYGGTYDDAIGALWVTPNRLRDPRLNCIAHELGHSFQCQIGADRSAKNPHDGGWNAGGFYEMASQWMLWQVNPDWITDEHYHYEAYCEQTHLAYLHIDNIYHSPYVLEYWSEQHGRDIIARLFKEGRKGEDPVQTYMRLTGISHQQFCEEMLESAVTTFSMNFRHARNETRRYAYQMGKNVPPLATGKQKQGDGWREGGKNLEAFGFDVIPLEGKGKKVELQGLTTENDADWKYRIVSAPDGRRWLIVMATPTQWHPLGRKLPVYPYRVRVR